MASDLMTEHYLITGGAGFIGTNLADHYLARKSRVTILDDFSRPGAEQNVHWLLDRHGDRLRVVRGDVRRPDGQLDRLVEDSDVVLHLAAQVAVTTSVSRPREDFEINALGTFNLLEAVRAAAGGRPAVLYSSTNKVYGNLEHVRVVERDGRYA